MKKTLAIGMLTSVTVFIPVFFLYTGVPPQPLIDEQIPVEQAPIPDTVAPNALVMALSDPQRYDIPASSLRNASLGFDVNHIVVGGAVVLAGATGSQGPSTWVFSAEDVPDQPDPALETDVEPYVCTDECPPVDPIEFTLEISGDPTIGSELTAVVNLPDEWVVAAYQWLRDEEPITDATDATYVVVFADIGSPISVQIIATCEGYADSVTTSNQITPSGIPMIAPSDDPSATPQILPSKIPVGTPSTTPADTPNKTPVGTPTQTPTTTPTSTPSKIPVGTPSAPPTSTPPKVSTENSSPQATPTQSPRPSGPILVPPDTPVQTPSPTPTVTTSPSPTSAPTTHMPTTYPTHTDTHSSQGDSYSRVPGLAQGPPPEELVQFLSSPGGTAAVGGAMMMVAAGSAVVIRRVSL